MLTKICSRTASSFNDEDEDIQKKWLQEPFKHEAEPITQADRDEFTEAMEYCYGGFP